ncbi:MAG: hypothetical protein ACOC56_00465 [Atribacterota bacterium]
MAFRKHNKWMQYGKSGKIIEIIIKDESDKRVDRFKCNNNKAFQQIANIIENKYGFSFKNDDKDNKSFLDKDMNW